MTVARRLPPRIVLAVIAGMFALLNLSAWWYSARSTFNAVAAPPLPARQEVAVSMWMGNAAQPTAGVRRNMNRLHPRRVTVAVWHQDNVGARSRPLAFFRLPAWPLLPIAAGLGITAGALRPRRKRIRGVRS